MCSKQDELELTTLPHINVADSRVIEKSDALSYPHAGTPLMTTFTFKYSFSLKNSSQCCTTVDLLKGAQKCHDNQLVLTQRGLLKVRNIKKQKNKKQNKF